MIPSLWTITKWGWNDNNTLLEFNVVSKKHAGLFCSILLQKLSQRDFQYYCSRFPVASSEIQHCIVVSEELIFLITYEYGSFQTKAAILNAMELEGVSLHTFSTCLHNGAPFGGLPPVIFQSLLGNLTAN